MSGPPMGGRFYRVDHDEVPESQHTVFIRGFPGDMVTEDVKDFFEDKIGACSFDFVKQSPDKSKLFMAVRFETRDAAKECMKKYNGDHVLGYPVELTWFRDIRRYVSYQQSQGHLPPRMDRGRGVRGMGPMRGGGYNRGSRGGPSGGYYSRDYDDSRSRFPPKHYGDDRHAHRRSRSRSTSGRSEGSRRSRSVDRRTPSHSPVSKRSSHSRSPLAQARSVSSDDVNKAHSVSSRSLSPVEEVKKMKKAHKKEKKKKTSRKRSVGSSDEISGSSDNEGARKRKMKKHRTPSPEEQDLRDKIAQLTAAKNGLDTMKPPPTIEPAPPATSSVARTLQNTIFKVDLTAEGGPPQRQVQIVNANGGKAKEKANAIGRMMPTLLPLPPTPPTMPASAASPAQAPRDVLMQKPANVDVPGARAAITGNNPVNARTSNAVLGEMKSIQQNVMNLVRSADAKKPAIAGSHHGVESETVTAGGSLKLSSFTKQISAESERDRKIAQLSPELFEQLNNKRKQLELAYKQDCETFGTVVKMLISKDASLEERLLAALHESLTEIGGKFVRQIDEHIDQLLLINA